MHQKRRSTDNPASVRSRRRVTLAAVLAAVAVAAAFAAAFLALNLNSRRTTDVEQLAAQVQALTLQTSRDSRVTTAALCALRHDLERRVASSQAYLLTHPHGLPGFPASTIRDGIKNQQRTIAALSGIDC